MPTPLVEAARHGRKTPPSECRSALKCTAWPLAFWHPFRRLRRLRLRPVPRFFRRKPAMPEHHLAQTSRHLRRRALVGRAAQQLMSCNLCNSYSEGHELESQRYRPGLTDLSPRAANTSKTGTKKRLLLGKGMRQALDRIIDLGGSDSLCLTSLGTSSACRTRRPISSARLFLRLCEQSCVQMVVII